MSTTSCLAIVRHVSPIICESICQLCEWFVVPFLILILAIFKVLDRKWGDGRFLPRPMENVRESGCNKRAVNRFRQYLSRVSVGKEIVGLFSCYIIVCFFCNLIELDLFGVWVCSPSVSTMMDQLETDTCTPLLWSSVPAFKSSGVRCSSLHSSTKECVSVPPFVPSSIARWHYDIIQTLALSLISGQRCAPNVVPYVLVFGVMT